MMKILYTFLIILMSSPTFGQATNKESNKKEFKIKKVRISLDVGFPNIAGLNLEYILPNTNRFSISSDLSYLPISYQDSKFTINYISFGSNYYFSDKARGFYLGINLGRLKIKANEIESTPVDLSVGFTTINPKFGLKLGNTFFIRLEVGYSMFFYQLDEANNFLNDTYGVTITPQLNYLQFWNGKLGIGVGF